MDKNKTILTYSNMLLHLSTMRNEVEVKLLQVKENPYHDKEIASYLQGQYDALMQYEMQIKTEFRYDPAVFA